jgi:5-methylcytosine-specific restriction endonuclease McrA
MSEDFGAGSIATLLMDIKMSGDCQPDPIEFKNIDYREYLKTEHWRVTSLAAKKRASFRCQLCNGIDRLNTHHRTYERLWQELPEDLIVLCEDCHAKHHDKLEPTHDRQYLNF